MKIYISLDMEGIPGTFNWEQEKTDRQAVKRCITHHVDSVVKAALKSSRAALIDEITIADSHSDCDNLDYSVTARDKRISLISGVPRPFYMMPDFSAGYDFVWLLGYHAGTGALGANMDHTYSNSGIHNIWINDKPMNEALVNAAYAGYHNVPVTLVTGDEALKAELAETMPWVDFVATKKAISKFSAKNYSPLLIDEMVQEAVENALQKDKEEVPLYVFEPPVALRIEFNSTSKADQASRVPYTKRLDGRTVEFSAEDYSIIMEAIIAMVDLASLTTM